MTSQISEADKQLRATPRMSLIIATVGNKARRNAYLFFSFVAAALVFFFSWNKWLFLIPAFLGVGAFFHHMNLAIISSEMKRRLKEEPDRSDED